MKSQTVSVKQLAAEMSAAYYIDYRINNAGDTLFCSLVEYIYMYMYYYTSR